jgi:hypothetical protein
MAEATCDVVKCESCRTPMLTRHTGDLLILYVCPNCVDWSASETQKDTKLFFVN